MDPDASSESKPAPAAITTNRLEAFSDGVFAIAITLLVLEIKLPADVDGSLWVALGNEWSSYLAYVVTFSTVGAIWLAHNVITEHLARVDMIFVRLNLLLLMVVALLPFPTRLIAEYLDSPDQERVAVTVYGSFLLVAVLLVSALWHHALRAKLAHDEVDAREAAILARRMTPGLGGYVVWIVIGLFFPKAAVVGYLVNALFLILPIRRERDERGADHRGPDGRPRRRSR